MQMPYFAICEFPNVYLNNSLQKVGCNIIAAQYNRFHDDCYNVSCNFSIGDNIVVRVISKIFEAIDLLTIDNKLKY